MKKAFVNALSIASLVIILLLCLYAIHDMQTAEGIGYYYTLKAGLSNRLIFDIVADLFFAVLFLALLLLPFKLNKDKSVIHFNELLLIFVAFMPTIRTSYVFDLFHNLESYKISVDIRLWTTLFISLFRILISLLVLLWGINMVLRNVKPSKGDSILLSMAVIIMLITVPFGGLYELSVFISSYLLIILIYKAMKEIENKVWPLYIFLFFTAIYRIITVCGAYSLG